MAQHSESYKSSAKQMLYDETSIKAQVMRWGQLTAAILEDESSIDSC